MDKIIKITLLILFFISFFGAIFFEFPGRSLVYMSLFFLFTVVYYKDSRYGRFNKLILGFFFSALLSVISCRFFRGQGLYVTILEYNSFFALAFYFYLHSEKVPIHVMEKIIIGFCMAFVIAYIIQYIVWPVHLFKGSLDEIHANKDNLRIRMVASGFASLGFFLGLNKVLCKSHNPIFYILIALAFISVLMMGFRTLLAGLIIMSAYMVVKVFGFSYKIVVVAIISIVLLFLIADTPLVQHVLGEMSKRQENEVFANADYIRWVQFDYFTNYHFKNDIEWFFGSGIPCMSKNSSYSMYFSRLDQSGINFQDWGLWGCSWVMGIPSFIFMMWYGIKAGFTKVKSPRYYYLGIWFLFMIMVSFTSFEFCRSGNFIVQSMVLYLLDKVYASKKNRYIDVPSRRKLWGGYAGHSSI